MSKESGLSTNDKNLIKENENEMRSFIQELDKARQFKLGDYLVASHLWGKEYGRPPTPVTNSYGVRVKYKVVHVDDNGIGYIKEVSSKGTVRGELQPLMGMGNDWQDYDGSYGTRIEYEHDPQFVEAIILSAEGSYDPTEVQRQKKARRDEVTNHNAAAKINCQDMDSLIAAFDQMKAGDVYWFSIKNNMTITNVTQVAPPYQHGLYKKRSPVNQIEVTLTNGKTATYLPHDFRYKNLYTAQPRTYKELSDTI